MPAFVSGWVAMYTMSAWQYDHVLWACSHVCLHMCMPVYVCFYIYVRVFIYTCVSVIVCACKYVHVHVCVCAHESVGVCACRYARTSALVRVCVWYELFRLDCAWCSLLLISWPALSVETYLFKKATLENYLPWKLTPIRETVPSEEERDKWM